MRSLLPVLAIVIAFLPTTLSAQQPIGWADLVDTTTQDFKDPFRDLSYDQIDHLRTIVRARDKLSGVSGSGNDLTKARARLEAAENALEQAGIDADWMLSQRQAVIDRRTAAATAGNPALDGQNVSVSGFAIPAPRSDDGTAAIYLVELAGLCSHTPPPHPNQLVRVQMNGDWTPEYVHQPVKLIGRLSIDPTEQVVRLVDGDVAMKATWRLDVQEVEAFTRKSTNAVGNSGWAEQLRSKLGAPKASVGQ